jgi:hypothetical protein
MVFSFIRLPPTIASTALHNTPYTLHFQSFAAVRRAPQRRAQQKDRNFLNPLFYDPSPTFAKYKSTLHAELSAKCWNYCLTAKSKYK